MICKAAALTRKELIELVSVYFLLSTHEEEILIAAIYVALRDSLIAQYNWNAFLLGITIDFLPSKKQEKLLEDLAHERGKGIAATYERDILRATTTLLDAYEQANGSLEGVLPELRATLKEYTAVRTEQKAQDISSYETGEGGNAGTETLIDDMGDAEEGDTVYVSPEDMAMIFVGILPFGGKCDLCDEWGGEMCELLDASSLPEMPAHPSCVHFLTLIDMRDEAA